MTIEQIYTGCLAQGAYFIESNGEALVIDPLREPAPYIERAQQSNSKIKYVLETHFHADFVSGHLDLARQTGATIIYGPTAKPGFEAHVAEDGEILKLGNATIQVLHTPGHTMESTCYLLRNEDGKEIALFSGDTLFIGDVGRPDLAQKINPELTSDKLAGYLYDSLHNRILPLADDIIVYPAHGAGSACGKNMSRETTDTLGHQKHTNYALQAMDKETFIKKVTEGLLPPPVYFPNNVVMNINGYERVDNIMNRGVHPLNPDAFERVIKESKALVIDTRAPQVFAKGFIPNAINIGIDGNFAPWVGTLVPDILQPILIVADPGKEGEVVRRLARVRYDHAVGFLDGGIDAWSASGRDVDFVERINPQNLAERLGAEPDAIILDVRNDKEYQSAHVIGAKHIPLEYINNHTAELDKDKTYYVHCAGGYRSMIFISMLRRNGYRHLVDVSGGFNAIKLSGSFEIEHDEQAALATGK